VYFTWPSDTYFVECCDFLQHESIKSINVTPVAMKLKKLMPAIH
jgi:hypothetical protein